MVSTTGWNSAAGDVFSPCFSAVWENSIRNISGVHGTLVHMLHILNLIHESQIQRYSYILRKTPPPSWLGIFANNSLSPSLSNIVRSEIDKSDLIYASCAPRCHMHQKYSQFYIALVLDSCNFHLGLLKKWDCCIPALWIANIALLGLL
jgi:hypothetical protein